VAVTVATAGTAALVAAVFEANGVVTRDCVGRLQSPRLLRQVSQLRQLPSQEGLGFPPALKDGPLAWSLSSKANWPTTARLASIQLDRASSNYLAPPLAHTTSD
jgi:hypothetical protein